MKLLAIIFALMTSTVAFAQESVRLVEDTLQHSPYSNYARATAKFYMDQDSTLGYAQIDVTEERPITYWETICHYPSGPRHPAPVCRQVPRTQIEYYKVYQHTELIPNLVLEGNKIIYNGENGTVECGTLGTSRVIRRPTLYLNGKCTLDARIVRDRADRKVIVDFKAKN